MNNYIQHNVLQRGLDAKLVICKSGDVCFIEFYVICRSPCSYASPFTLHALVEVEGRKDGDYTQTQSTSLVVVIGVDGQSSLVFQMNGGVRFVVTSNH